MPRLFDDRSTKLFDRLNGRHSVNTHVISRRHSSDSFSHINKKENTQLYQRVYAFVLGQKQYDPRTTSVQRISKFSYTAPLQSSNIPWDDGADDAQNNSLPRTAIVGCKL